LDGHRGYSASLHRCLFAPSRSQVRQPHRCPLPGKPRDAMLFHIRPLADTVHSKYSFINSQIFLQQFSELEIGFMFHCDSHMYLYKLPCAKCLRQLRIMTYICYLYASVISHFQQINNELNSSTSHNANDWWKKSIEDDNTKMDTFSNSCDVPSEI